jgi:hypothetical protein
MEDQQEMIALRSHMHIVGTCRERGKVGGWKKVGKRGWAGVEIKWKIKEFHEIIIKGQMKSSVFWDMMLYSPSTVKSTFWKNMFPSSWLKYKPSKKPAWSRQQTELLQSSAFCLHHIVPRNPRIGSLYGFSIQVMFWKRNESISHRNCCRHAHILIASQLDWMPPCIPFLLVSYHFFNSWRLWPMAWSDHFSSV